MDNGLRACVLGILVSLTMCVSNNSSEQGDLLCEHSQAQDPPTSNSSLACLNYKVNETLINVTSVNGLQDKAFREIQTKCNYRSTCKLMPFKDYWGKVKLGNLSQIHPPTFMVEYNCIPANTNQSNDTGFQVYSFSMTCQYELNNNVAPETERNKNAGQTQYDDSQPPDDDIFNKHDDNDDEDAQERKIVIPIVATLAGVLILVCVAVLISKGIKNRRKRERPLLFQQQNLGKEQTGSMGEVGGPANREGHFQSAANGVDGPFLSVPDQGLLNTSFTDAIDLDGDGSISGSRVAETELGVDTSSQGRASPRPPTTHHTPTTGNETTVGLQFSPVSYESQFENTLEQVVIELARNNENSDFEETETQENEMDEPDRQEQGASVSPTEHNEQTSSSTSSQSEAEDTNMMPESSGTSAINQEEDVRSAPDGNDLSTLEEVVPDTSYNNTDDVASKASSNHTNHRASESSSNHTDDGDTDIDSRSTIPDENASTTTLLSVDLVDNQVCESTDTSQKT